MYIRHIILEGFKSYRERTDIGPFDPHFNAITGLNGSGKSNILDAICFVLGLSSMGVVRAANLSELIYKGGAGGVNRASASIVFDNRNKAHGKCPIGFEKFEEIVVSRTVEATGSCKYYVNSITSTKKQITDLFESVQLNISSPNFMIMQGKITKVINMTPKQILCLIEETVGGNVYQGKRDKTAQEISNKDRCIELVRSTIQEEIHPEWKRQRDAREKLQEFQTVEFENARASKYYAIVKFQDLQEKLKNSEHELNQVLELEKKDDSAVLAHKKEIDVSKKRQEQMKQENHDKFKDKIGAAEKAMNAEKKHFVAAEAQVKIVQEEIDTAKEKLKQVEKAKKVQEKEMVDYKKTSANTVGEFEQVKSQIATAEDELNKAKEQENALKLGNIVDEEGKTCDARQELMKVQDEIHKIQPDFQVGSQEYEEDIRKLEQMQKELKKTPTNDQVERDYNAKFQRAEQLKAEAIRRNINPDDSPSEITKSLNNSKELCQKLSQEKEAICGRHFYLAFRYDRKEMVDSAKIHGCLYELLKFNNLEEWGGGLEVLAGGLFGQLVVDDENTGKALLKAGLCRRMMIHPLSVFRSTNTRRISQQDLDRQLGQGKAIPAIDLIQCDPRYKPIVQHFFGGKVLCDTIETAKTVAFKMGFYAVSKIGDVADPDGVMQGGSRQNLGQLINTCERLRQICVELKHNQREIADLQNRLKTAQSNTDFMKQLEVSKRDCENASKTRELTTYSVLQREIVELKQKLEKDAEVLKGWKQTLDQLEKEKKTWSNKVNQLEHLREKSKKDNAALINKWQKALETAKKKYESKQKHFGDIDIELKSREALVHDCQKEVETVLEEINEYNETLGKANEKFVEIRAKFDQVQSTYNAAVAESEEWNAEYNEIEGQIRELNNAIHKIELSKIKRGNAKEKYEANYGHCESELKKLKTENRTINFEQEQIPDEEKKSLHEHKADAEKYKKTFDELRERIDVEAAEQYESTKRHLNNAEDKLKTIETNKKELEKTMGKLDEHKLNIVMEAYNKVNEEFNKMMGTLLPDSAARLVPVNYGDLSQGLNIHVQLGGIWKESLSELSGGQKSLVALALVLSLCMYNPCPFYILDEIDSALDLNHTQNIGVLIKKKFVDTQFVCVSLKDGMYSNCNILFQVQFSNGKSEVKRCVRQSSKNPEANDHQVVTSKQEKRFNKIVSGK